MVFKCAFAIFGAMMLTDNSNMFSGLLFDVNQNEATLMMLGVYCLLIVLPQAIDYQKQAKYFASLGVEDAIPCNQFLVGLLLPWLIACILCHLQIFALLINWTTLILGMFVVITCSLLMWTTQMEESMVHEKNFRESITMLVIKDKRHDSEISDSDSDKSHED